MIQRIQSLYLLLSGLGLFGLFALPFAQGDAKSAGIFMDGMYNLSDSQALMIAASAAGAMAIIAIFLFKNRKLQKQVIGLLIFLILFLAGFAVGLYFKSENTGAGIQLGSALPLVALVLAVLANRGVTKDQNLVKSMDRLR